MRILVVELFLMLDERERRVKFVNRNGINLFFMKFFKFYIIF